MASRTSGRAGSSMESARTPIPPPAELGAHPGPLMQSTPVDCTCTLTVEQLAFETGMSVRNIRSHQARGLLAPPEVRVRVGYYGPEHLAQLQMIRELQNDGFNLGGIKRLMDD